MPDLYSFENLAALATLTALEIVLGIDNIVFIAIVTGKLPQQMQSKARSLGLILALTMRILLLVGVTWVMRLIEPLFQVLGHAVTGKDLVLILGGLFLLYKGTHELHGQVEGMPNEEGEQKAALSLGGAILQIGLLDIIFSLDSVITAVGMARHIAIMIAAVVLAIVIMIIFAGRVSRFIEQHPTMRVLALAFLLLIGVMLVAEGAGQHIDRGYIYFAMAFSLGVELINMRRRNRLKPPAATG